jgi:hypothetical protein
VKNVINQSPQSSGSSSLVPSGSSQRITQECGPLRLEKRPVSQRFLISWLWYGLQLLTAQNEDLMTEKLVAAIPKNHQANLFH